MDSDKDHIKIKWSSPISNGGSPIVGYDVERRDRATGRWIKVNKDPIPLTEFNDDHVQAGHEYEYRVSAVNAAGVGKPSDTSSVFVAKPMKGNLLGLILKQLPCIFLFSEKPKLWLDGLIGRRIKVRAGEPVNIDIPISGAPIPQVSWTKNGVPVSQSNRVSVSLRL